MFKVGDKVFYPHHGAGIIKKKAEQEILGKKGEYLFIRFPLTETTIMIPSDNPIELGLRYLSDEIEIKRCLQVIAQSTSDSDEDWKVRYKKHQDMLKTGSLAEISEVIKNLHDRNEIKELSSTEKKLYQSAVDMLVSEIALSVDREREDVKGEIERILTERNTVES